jgi:hypothetical protein
MDTDPEPKNHAVHQFDRSLPLSHGSDRLQHCPGGTRVTPSVTRPDADKTHPVSLPKASLNTGRPYWELPPNGVQWGRDERGGFGRAARIPTLIDVPKRELAMGAT